MGFIYKIYLQEREKVYLKVRTINLKSSTVWGYNLTQ